METATGELKKAKDFATDQDVRWCPGCGDYSILKQVQQTLADVGAVTENTVFISGIGCSSRFPYYMNTYGIHSIHGRAPAFASGLKAARPDLDIWVVTGDGDGLSIGGNHLLHALRRNFNINILLFNNEIYGLTKGQYSPTSPRNKVTKSSPVGSLEEPFNPLALVLGANASFVARTMDRDPKHLRDMLKQAHEFNGTSFIEIYQNCNVFNDGAFFSMTEKTDKPINTVYLEQGKPLVFGAEGEKVIGFRNMEPCLASSGELMENEIWIHDEASLLKASLLSRFFGGIGDFNELPRPFGVIYKKHRENYETRMKDQIENEINRLGNGSLKELLSGSNTWSVD